MKLTARTMTPRRAMPTALTERRETTAPAMGTCLWWRICAAVSVLTLTVLNVIVAQQARSTGAPRTPWDEVGVIQMARMLAGKGPVTEMSGSGYYPGWSIVMSPIWWFTDDPEAFYRAAIWLVIATAIATVIPLTLIGRRLGLTTAQAVTAAAIALSLPARTVNADYTLSENMFTFLIAWAAVAAFAMWDRPTWRTTGLFVLAVFGAYLTHARGIALALTAAVWLMLFFRRSPRHALSGLIGLGVAAFGVQRIASAITDRVLLDGFGKEELMSTALSTTTPGLMAQVAVSQSWAQLVGSFGLVGIGAVVIVVWTVRELREAHVGQGGFLFGLAASTLAVSIMWWAGERFLVDQPFPRFDVWVYTRYIDPVALLVVVVAIAAIIRRADLWLILAAGLASCGVIALALTMVAPHVPTFGSMYGPANAAGVLHWTDLRPDTYDGYARPLFPSLTNENRFWAWASLSVVAVLTLVVITRRRPRVLTSMLLVVAAVSSWHANPEQTRDAPTGMREAIERTEQVTGGGFRPVEFDLQCDGGGQSHAQTLNWVGYWFSPREVRAVPDQRFDAELVISCQTWLDAEALDAAPLSDSQYLSYQVWVLPGPLQGHLREAGLIDESARP